MAEKGYLVQLVLSGSAYAQLEKWAGQAKVHEPEEAVRLALIRFEEIAGEIVDGDSELIIRRRDGTERVISVDEFLRPPGSVQ